MKNLAKLLLLTAAVLLFAGCGQKVKEAGEAVVEQATGISALQQKLNADRDLAIGRATALYAQKVVEGMSMENGPCLSNEIIPDWVLDIAHNPRQEADDQPKNQCSAYRKGMAHHFVELDINGALIKAE